MAAKFRQRAFTVIELMIVVVVAAVLVATAAPSLRDLIAMQRLKSVTAELVTDLRYARSMAISRQSQIFVDFAQNANMSCYIVYIPSGISFCDCLNNAPGQACVPGVAAGGAEELRTVQIPASTDIGLANVTAAAGSLIFGPDGLRSVAAANTVLRASRISGRPGKTQVTVNVTSRPAVCSNDNSVPGMPPCPP